MTWRKRGQIYSPSGKLEWATSHAANPIAEHLEGNIFRIYFSTRDVENRSSIGFIEVDITTPEIVLRESQQPLISPGALAMFDDAGASIGCLIKIDGARHIYYMGWHLSVSVPWQNTIGLAREASLDRGDAAGFQRHSQFPIISLDETDPYTLSYPWVIHDNGTYKMWYGSNVAWGPKKSDMRHLIKYAESADGINWDRQNATAIDFLTPDEYAVCKPCVIKSNDMYEMWFCARGDAYQIYYARSDDGVHWSRTPEPDLSVSEAGWDSEMVEYPCVFDHKEQRYMLYCGNSFGKTGFGLARWDPRGPQ